MATLAPTTGTQEDDRPDRRPVVRLRGGHQKRLRQGHPWAYSNEIEMDAATRGLPPGSVVTLADANGAPLAAATFNPHSLIAARVLARDAATAIDGDFFADRLRAAAGLRDKLFDRPFYRLAHAEADRLPGLVIDRFDTVFVVEPNTAGMDRLLPRLLEALETVFAPEAIVVRADNAVRRLEGLDQSVTVAKGEIAGPVALVENGVAFFADVVEGQKTGWFYDQRVNRARVAALADGKSVLDVYCHTGGFGVQAAAAGAAEVVCIDSSERALALAGAAAEENGIAARCTLTHAEAFAALAGLAQDGKSFDIVVADPPAFVKSKKDLGAGLKGYRKLFRLAASLVRPGGFLFFASCSYHVGPDRFAEVVRHGLTDIRRDGRVLATAGAGPDHPVHPFLPETAYLRTALLQLD